MPSAPRTERLRALRLAKEAADREAALNAPPPPPKPAKGAKAPKMKVVSKAKAPAKKKK